MSSSNDNAIWTFSQNFTTEFRTVRSELEARLDRVKASPSSEAIQALSVDLAKLTKALSDASGSLPSYDQKLYETQLKSLEATLDELRIAFAPKPRFAFKRKSTAASSPNPVTQPVQRPSTVTPLTASSNSFISSHTRKYLMIDSLVGPPPMSDLTISNLDHCILNLLSANDQPHLDKVSAIHLKRISNSVLLLPVIKGSILIHDLTRCVIVLGCHQFRMHTSTKTDVFLSIASNPIIEDCQYIRFAAYPKALEMSEHSAEGLAVQDFSHIRNTPSPNWAHMNNSDMTREWPTKPLQSATEVESSLQNILPM